MNNITNWRYEKWKNNQDNSDKLTSGSAISHYISWEIYPEDIELFINVLAPSTIVYKNCVIRCENESQKESVCQRFDSWLLEVKDVHIAQGQVNLCNVADIFLNTSNDTLDSTIKNVARLIKNNWEFCLYTKYPDRNFEVYIVGESLNTYVNFFERV